MEQETKQAIQETDQDDFKSEAQKEQEENEKAAAEAAKDLTLDYGDEVKQEDDLQQSDDNVDLVAKSDDNVDFVSKLGSLESTLH